MNRNFLLVVVSMILGIVACTAAAQSGSNASRQSSRQVATALEHLTVLEYEEPVTQAAVGSSSFQIERQENKVFIKPLKSNASTNLVVWTTSGRQFSYELSVADVSATDAVIHIANPNPVPSPDSTEKLEKSTAMAVRRTLLGTEPIDSAGVNTPKNGIGVRIEEVYRDNATLFIRYSLENRTTKTYQIVAPALYELRTDAPGISLATLKRKQLDQRTTERLGETKQVAVPCSHDSDETNVAPGAIKQGLIAVRETTDWPSPTVLQLVFAANVKATLVL